jgi:hypothetical protein
VDEEQMQRAILDPYGYLQNETRAATALPCSWTLVKQLYR